MKEPTTLGSIVLVRLLCLPRQFEFGSDSSKSRVRFRFFYNRFRFFPISNYNKVLSSEIGTLKLVVWNVEASVSVLETTPGHHGN